LRHFHQNESVFQEVTERKNKDGYNCTHCGSKQFVRFGKYKVKLGLKELERQCYRCKIVQRLLQMLLPHLNIALINLING